jgi:hypothetical protein
MYRMATTLPLYPRSILQRTAVRRGAPRARPGGATKQLLGSARGYLALEDGLTAEPAWAAEAPQAPSTGTRLSVQRAVARHGGPGGPDAGRAFVTLSASTASVRRPVSEASDQCPRVPVHAIGVQCPLRASERPGVRCPASDVRCGRPVWASGVRAFPRPLWPAGVRSWTAAVGQAAARLGGPGSAWSPDASMTGSWSARVGAWRSKLAQAVMGQRRCRFWTWPSSWEVVGQWPGRPRGRPG